MPTYNNPTFPRFLAKNIRSVKYEENDILETGKARLPTMVSDKH
jgi:hypothetical protein